MNHYNNIIAQGSRNSKVDNIVCNFMRTSSCDSSYKDTSFDIARTHYMFFQRAKIICFLIKRFSSHFRWFLWMLTDQLIVNLRWAKLHFLNPCSFTYYYAEVTISVISWGTCTAAGAAASCTAVVALQCYCSSSCTAVTPKLHFGCIILNIGQPTRLQSCNWSVACCDCMCIVQTPLVYWIEISRLT
jgi:hypothetical protein